MRERHTASVANHIPIAFLYTNDMKKTLLPLILLIITAPVYAQQKDSISHLLKLSMESLMDIPIYSASKNQEPNFEAPLSSTVITKEQIKRAGCTSIMDALRLAPGVMVREQTNGNYDIHLRGLDNVPPNSNLIFFTNSTTLVMIDNFPVYNYLHGGTFWETLPVDLADVERIEVVRGPSAAMYGPNAVSGVINIITRKPEKEGMYAVGKVQYGHFQSLVANAAAGYAFKNKLSAVLSANFQNRNRTQDAYYDVVQNKYVDLDSVTAVRRNPAGNVDQYYPHRELAMRKYAVNGFIHYNRSDNIRFSVAGGIQHAEVQKAFGSDTYAAYITTAKSDAVYANLKGNLYNFTVQLSYLNGTQSPVAGAKIWKWDFNTFDAVVEYNFDKIKNLNITPGVIFRNAVYDDSKYVKADIREGFWSGRAESVTRAASLRAEYKLLNKQLRLVAGGRIDKFNYPEKAYFSYQLAATYKIKEQHLVRAVHSQANRAPLIIDMFSNLDLTGQLNANQTYLLEIRGNKNIKLLSSNMFEIGYRGKLRDNLEVDFELFHTRTRDFSNTVFESGTFNSTEPVGFRGLLDINNVAVFTKQWGGTMAVNFITENWQLKPFVTLQTTTLYDYSPYLNAPGAPPLPSNNNNPALNNIYSGKGTKMGHTGTPSWYGGAYINWTAGEKVNVNFNVFYYSTHTQLHSSNLTYNDGQRGVDRLRSKFIFNTVIQYAVTNRLTLCGNFRNCFNDKSREFYKSDEVPFMFFAGVHFEF
jgi:iron complex outermembrane recepter protein